MFKKNIFTFSLIAAILVVIAGLLLHTQPASADSGTLNGHTSSCLGCHEDLYYNYDTGKHYCLTEASTRCVDCHAGNPEALDEKTAHAGLIVHPILNGDISRCKSCHQQDAQAHADTFAALAGYSSVVSVAAQVQPVSEAQVVEEPKQEALDAKVVAGISIVVAVVVALFVFCILTNRSCH